ncbi:hypothetical protein BJX65DRAFT_305207 [Aspergillus insuetus]
MRAPWFFSLLVLPFISVEGEKRTIPRLFELPHEILLMIHSFLPLPSQACLALTCEPLYNVFTNSITPRTQLLLQLQTLDNPFCGACLKLHRRDEFPENLPDILERKCRFGDNVVDLCHCLALTPMTGAKLRGWIRSGIAPTTLDQSIFTAFWPVNARGQLVLRHICTATNRQHGTLDLHMQLRLVDSGQLVVRTRHSLAITTLGIKQGWPQLGSFRDMTESLFGCPHRNLMHIGWFDSNTVRHKCHYCQTVSAFVGHWVPESVFEWVTHRNLGTDSDHEPWQATGRCLSYERKRMEACLQSL